MQEYAIANKLKEIMHEFVMFYIVLNLLVIKQEILKKVDMLNVMKFICVLQSLSLKRTSISAVGFIVLYKF